MTPAEIRDRIAAAREWCDAEIIASSQIASLLEILDSGAVFIAVPDGEPMPAEDAREKFNFVLHNNTLCMPEYHIWSWVDHEGYMPNIHTDTLVQPVKLINLKEEP